ncbi:MAG: helix-turn-helix transcriptional regulator [Syntrophomonas sp.]
MSFPRNEIHELAPLSNHSNKTPLLSIPVNPLLYASLRAIYSGGSMLKWNTDIYGRPYYDYLARDGQITISYELPATGYLPWNPPAKGLPAFHRHFLGPRWGFIYSGRLRAALSDVSVETADVLLILMAKIAGLQDVKRDTARISLEEIAETRGVRLRHGKSRELYEALKEEVFRLSDFRVSMVWRDYKNKRELYWGQERPDRLLDIVDIECKRDRKTVRAFGFRCGLAMAHFLDPHGLRWIGHYSKALLNLSPYHEAFAKIVGTYWIMVGITAGKKGAHPIALPQTILDFCGEDINRRNPGRTVDSFIKAHETLVKIGVLDDVPALEPQTRKKGYFEKWMNTPLTVKLSQSLWKIASQMNENKPLNSRPVRKKGRPKHQNIFSGIPQTIFELQRSPDLIRSFRQIYGMNQIVLARAIKVSRQTLSNYERGINPIPEDKAIKILNIWNNKTRPIS